MSIVSPANNFDMFLAICYPGFKIASSTSFPHFSSYPSFPQKLSLMCNYLRKLLLGHTCNQHTWNYNMHRTKESWFVQTTDKIVRVNQNSRLDDDHLEATYFPFQTPDLTNRLALIVSLRLARYPMVHQSLAWLAFSMKQVICSAQHDMQYHFTKAYVWNCLPCLDVRWAFGFL